MNDEITSTPSIDMELAKMLGARQAYGLVAGRCSAADASILRDIRDGKKYLGVSSSWDDFCTRHLHMTRRNANRVIALLNELGPGYFALAQLTRITPEEFRAIAPAIRDNCIEHRGEAIALLEENAGRLAEAICDLRRDSAAECPPQADWQKRIESVRLRFRKTAGELKLLVSERDAYGINYGGVIQEMRAELDAIERAWNRMP